jgi:hypothetical protein
MMEYLTTRESVKYKLLLRMLMLTTLTLFGCQATVKNEQSDVALGQFVSLQPINDYLSANLASTGFGGKPYCAYEVIDAEVSAEIEKVYLWVLCQEFYRVNQTLKQGTGSSFPLALMIKRKNNEFYVVSHLRPRDGGLYAQDMQVMFSTRFRNKIRAESIESHNQRVQKLQNEVQRKTEIK